LSNASVAIVTASGRPVLPAEEGSWRTPGARGVFRATRFR